MREANSVCQDKKGFIWTSSKTGVLRLAGVNYCMYELPYENNDVITLNLLYTNSGPIAYTNNGQFFKYNEINDKFELLVNISKTLSNKFILVKKVLVDNSGSYWIATSFGLYRYRNRHLTLIQNLDETDYLAWYDLNNMFVARPDGIWLFNKQTLKRICLYRYKQKLDLSITKFYYDNKAKRLWIGTVTNGLFYYDLKNHSKSLVQINAIPKQPILAIEQISDTTILLGIDGQGLWELNKRNSKILNIYKEDVNNPSSLRGNGVYDIFNDQNKRIWISTYSGGVSFFDHSSPIVDQITHTVNNPNSLVNDNVNKIIQDKTGNIWFATDNGLSCKEYGTGKWRTYYHNQLDQATVFVSLCEDDKGQIWAGTYSTGIYVLDEHTGRELHHYSKGVSGFTLETNFVLDIFKDSQGDIWIGGAQGSLICYLSKESKFRKYSPQPILAFSELSPNKLLLACTFGLILLDKKSGNFQTILDGYLIQDLISIKDDIWICTSGEGLIKYDKKTNKIQKITTVTGLPSNYVNSIMYADGYFWLGTENGLCRLNPKNMDVLTYYSVYPLSQVSFNRNSNYRLRDGQLIWGTNNGAVSFSTKLLTMTQSNGVIFFQNLYMAGRSIRGSLSAPLDSLRELSLNFNQNTLQLDILSIGNLLGTKFTWKLEGFDNNWSQPSENRSIQYSNIPSGQYVLKIRLYDSSLSKIISERTLDVNIIPPFWRTWWFEIFLFALIVGLFYMVLFNYIERFKQQHTEEKVRFFTNTAHEFRTSLTLIKSPIEELTKEKNISVLGQYNLSLAIEHLRRLSTVVTQLMDFQKTDINKEQLALSQVDIVSLVENRQLMFESLATKQKVNLHFSKDQECYQTAVDVSMIEKVIDNLLSNAIKYSHYEGEVHINLTCKPDNWTLEIKDNGIGICKKAQSQLFSEFYRGENAINSKIVGSGIGLLLVKSYVKMHDGEISFVSQENVGSVFKVVIPFKETNEDFNQVNSNLNDSHPDVLKEVNSKSLQQLEEFPIQVMHILIVEDNDDLRNFMLNTLQSDFDVLLARDGIEAWDIIQKQMPDMVVSDVLMPSMDGFELCRLIKSTHETSHIPVILLSALSGKDEQLHGLGLGADDYLTKPFDMSLLVQRIKSIIRNREIVKEKALKLIKGNYINSEPILTNYHNDKFMKKMLEVVMVNIANSEFGKIDFASSMNVSPSLLYKKVKSFTDQSPSDFIKMVRLDYALELLNDHKYSITEISELCGFSTIGYFSTVFKKRFGKSPTDI